MVVLLVGVREPLGATSLVVVGYVPLCVSFNMGRCGGRYTIFGWSELYVGETGHSGIEDMPVLTGRVSGTVAIVVLRTCGLQDGSTIASSVGGLVYRGVGSGVCDARSGNVMCGWVLAVGLCGWCEWVRPCAGNVSVSGLSEGNGEAATVQIELTWGGQFVRVEERAVMGYYSLLRVGTVVGSYAVGSYDWQRGCGVVWQCVYVRLSGWTLRLQRLWEKAGASWVVDSRSDGVARTGGSLTVWWRASISGTACSFSVVEKSVGGVRSGEVGDIKPAGFWEGGRGLCLKVLRVGRWRGGLLCGVDSSPGFAGWCTSYKVVKDGYLFHDPARTGGIYPGTLQ
ncbi:hypothetical protein Tco_0959543 [Tanacetum coccineum]